MKISAVIVAGGEGRRMGGPKQFIEIAGKPMVLRALLAFDSCGAIDEMILVVPKDEISRAKELIKKFSVKKVSAVVAGGQSRQASVYNGLKAVSEDSDYVLIHDGARPLIAGRSINDLITSLKGNDACILAVPVTDTIKEVKDGREISRTLDREVLWSAQTPQGFKTSLIKEAHERAKKNGYSVTDDSLLLERLGHKVKVVWGSYENIKVTTPFDVKLAECVIERRRKEK